MSFVIQAISLTLFPAVMAFAASSDFFTMTIANRVSLILVGGFSKAYSSLLAFIAYVVIAVTISGSPTKQGKHDELAGGTQVVKG